MNLHFCVVAVASETATFRNPEFQNFHKSLPLPPPSTVIGFAGAALGLSAKAAQEYFPDKDFWIGVQGSSAGITKDLWKYRVFKSSDKSSEESTSIILKEIFYGNQFVLVYGAKDENIIKQLVEAFRSPVYALSLGSSDSLAKIKSVQYTQSLTKSREIERCLVEGDIIQEVMKHTNTGLDFSIYTSSEPITHDLPTKFCYESEYGVRRVVVRQQISFVGNSMLLNVEKEGIRYENVFVPVFPLELS